MDAWTAMTLNHQIACELRREATRYRLAKLAAAAPVRTRWRRRIGA